MNLFLLLLLSPNLTVPSIETIKAARDADVAQVRSFVLTGHGAEQEFQTLPPALQNKMVEAQVSPDRKTYEKSLTTPRPSTAAADRYNKSVRVAYENIAALKERAKLTPIELVVTCDFSLPTIAKGITGLRDVASIASTLKLGVTATAALNKERTTIATDKTFTYYNKYAGTRMNGTLDPERERLVWLGILPSSFSNANSVIETTEAGLVIIRTKSEEGNVEKEYWVDPEKNYRVIRYKSSQDGDVVEQFTAVNYVVITSVSGTQATLVPLNTTLKQRRYGVADGYILITNVDNLEFNPAIDSNKFEVPAGVRILGNSSQ